MSLVQRAATDYSSRVALCQRCPHKFVWYGRIRCNICKCFMEVKARIPWMKCPLNIW